MECEEHETTLYNYNNIITKQNKLIQNLIWVIKNGLLIFHKYLKTNKNSKLITLSQFQVQNLTITHTCTTYTIRPNKHKLNCI